MGDDREPDEGENDGERDDAAAACAKDEVVQPDPELIRRRATARAKIWASMVKVAADENIGPRIAQVQSSSEYWVGIRFETRRRLFCF